MLMMAWSYNSHYATLQVPESATAAEVKAAFTALAKELHPDVNSAPRAAERFQRVKEAYDVLRDAQLRRVYDVQLGASRGSYGGDRDVLRQRADTFRRTYQYGSGSGTAAQEPYDLRTFTSTGHQRFIRTLEQLFRPRSLVAVPLMGAAVWYAVDALLTPPAHDKEGAPLVSAWFDPERRRWYAVEGSGHKGSTRMVPADHVTRVAGKGLPGDPTVKPLQLGRQQEAAARQPQAEPAPGRVDARAPPAAAAPSDGHAAGGEPPSAASELQGARARGGNGPAMDSLLQARSAAPTARAHSSVGSALVWGTGSMLSIFGLLALPFFVVPWLPRARFGALPYMATSPRRVKAMLDALPTPPMSLLPGSRRPAFVDLGSGDGVAVLAAATRGYRAIGVELNPTLWAVSYVRSLVLGLHPLQVRGRGGSASFRMGSMFDERLVGFGSGDVVMAFGVVPLMPRIAAMVHTQCGAGTTFVSHKFGLGGGSEAERAFSHVGTVDDMLLYRLDGAIFGPQM
jgi:hypothetical protein